jgi:hypothetical protein
MERGSTNGAEVAGDKSGGGSEDNTFNPKYSGLTLQKSSTSLLNAC